ncbi:MAG: sialidase family protein [Bacteroidota bacterium]|nr:sialidase family protein [Bacteroidota bacterium]
MRQISAVLLVLFSLSGFSQHGVDEIGPDYQEYIVNGQPVAIHLSDFTDFVTGSQTVISNSSTGDVLANSIPGSGAFYIKARIRITNMGGTAASFQLGKNYFGFDGRQNDIYLNGPIFGKEVISLKPNKDLLQSGEWFTFEIMREDSLVSFMINNVNVHQVIFNGEFTGKMGLHPLRAIMEISEFSARGSLVPVSLMPPGFTIPIIDIAHETNRHVIIGKEKDQYLGHPTTVLLEDGKTMYIVYPEGHGRGSIIMKKSLDRGKTWSKRLEVPESWASSKEVPTLYPTVDKDGKKRIIMFSGLNPIRLAVSENNGKSWSELKPIFNFGGIVAMGDMIRLKNGDYMAFFHDDGRFITGDMKRQPRFYVYSTTSKDGGLTWGNPQIVTTEKYMKLCEPGVIRSPDGNQIAMLLRENGRKYNSAIVFSDDEGHTWSDPVELPSSLTGDRHQCLYANDGRLVITFRDHAYQSPMQGDFVAWVGTYEDLVNKTEGQYRIRLLDNKSRWDCGYPAFEIFPDGSFFAATYGKWETDHPNYVMGTRFSLGEIDQKAKEIPQYTDVFIEGEEGYHTYRIPALWKSSKGSILAFAEGRESKSDHAANDIVLKRSLDGGASWGSLQVVAEQGDDCLNNPLIVEDQRNNRLILMWQKFPEGYHERQVGTGYDSDTICRGYMQYSEDDGITWTSPREITPMVKRPTWVTSVAGGPGNGIQITKGPYKNRLVMPFNQGPSPKWKVYAVYSDDGGDTWEYGDVAFELDGGNGNEVQMVELADGSIMLNSRSANGKKLRKTAISKDGGANWTGLKDEEQLIEPQCMGSIISLASENLVKSALIFSNPYTQTDRRFGTLQVSLDDGQTWIINKCVYNGSYAYSSLANMGNEQIGLLFERDNYSAISFLKTELKWLTRKN